MFRRPVTGRSNYDGRLKPSGRGPFFIAPMHIPPNWRELIVRVDYRITVAVVKTGWGVVAPTPLPMRSPSIIRRIRMVRKSAFRNKHIVGHSDPVPSGSDVFAVALGPFRMLRTKLSRLRPIPCRFFSGNLCGGFLFSE